MLMRHLVTALASLVLGIVPSASTTSLQDPSKEDLSAYTGRMNKWRVEQNADLTDAQGWLSVAGLYWLAEGVNKLGNDPSDKVQLPAATGYGELAEFTLNAGHVSIHVLQHGVIKINGKPAVDAELKTDATGVPDKIQIADLTLTIIERGDRIGIRMRDPDRQARKDFKGMRWFPLDRSYQINADFKPYDKPRQIPITNVLGDIRMATSPGYVEFKVSGKVCRLEAESTDDGLFFNFTDKTTGKATYSAGRFLDAPKPVDGHVLLDFNQATCPPCAFTPFATCPLPPSGNHLKVAIMAGEMAPLGKEVEPAHKAS